MACYIGLDVGSVSSDLVVMDESAAVMSWRYERTYGRPLQVALAQLEEAARRWEDVKGLCVTGSGAKTVAELLGVPFVNEIVAQSKATAYLLPGIRTIVEIGGEDAKLILMEKDEDGMLRIGDFAMNDICAAGTGSFLDQQATRLGVSIEEFSLMALKSERPPRIAGRCSVFAKTDMIHLQQQGTPDYDIVAGLCYAMARNLKNNIGRGKEFVEPIAFQGGVAANAGMVRAFTAVLGLEPGSLIIPEYFNCMGAVGAVLDVRDRGLDCGFEDLEPLRRHLGRVHAEAPRLEPLSGDGYMIDMSCQPLPQTDDKIDVYVGVDVGSISTNVVVIDSEKRVLARRYLMTEGRPIEAVKKGLYEVGQEVGDRVVVKGCATTGSGRYLTGEFIGADIVKNEITTHARGAVTADRRVDTIFEIGGQDAKYISLENGVVVDFAMNKVCAAGTGSFLEEQAERLGLKIQEEFGSLALSSDAPVHLGERCTVFMESDLNYHQHRGLPTDDLVAGLCHSIVYNYLNRVVEDHKIGDFIFFQGGVAFNRGVKAAFESVLGKKVIVPPHQDIMGAIGAAIIAMESSDGSTDFKGFDLRGTRYDLRTFECKGCSNRCEIHQVSIEGQKPLYYGSRCGKYDEEKKHKKGEDLPDLFREREHLLLDSYAKRGPESPVGVTVGIPRVATFHDLYPLWKAFFTEIGCEVVLSDPTNREIIQKGVDAVASESCFPIHAAHGHVLNLMEKDVDYIFVPSVVNMEHEAEQIVHSYTCPLVHGLPYLLRAALDFDSCRGELLAPVFHFESGRQEVNKQLRKLGQMFEVPQKRLSRALEEGWRALERFRDAIRRRGQELLSQLAGDRLALVIVSRSYNGCDPGLNLGVPEKLRDMGVLAIPMDFLPLDPRSIQDEFPHMYWKYGQSIISAGKFLSEHDNLHAVYITNFRCGPDSFITKFFSRVLGKPYLTLEIDEHSADVGALTRCEAFLDSLQHARRGAKKKPRGEDLFFDVRERGRDIRIYIPYMDDHGLMMGAVLKSNGIDAEALPMSDHRSLELGRSFTTGKECYPCILTTGDIVKKATSDGFDPERSAFFMAQANGPCRFGQYHKLHRMVLDELGFERVPMVVLDQTEEFSNHVQTFGPDFYRSCWDLIVTVDFLQKMVRETRPYEVSEGETDRVYDQCLRELAEVAEAKGDYMAKAAELAGRMRRIQTDRSERRPIIGIVGEIYVRSNQFANNFLVRGLEELGAQVMLPTFQEWISYIAYDRREIAKENGLLWAFARECFIELAARRGEGRVARLFNGALEVMPREVRTAEVLRLGSRYIAPSVKGEAILSMGRAVEYAHHGLNGVVNVAPFGCMPGSLVNGLLEQFRRDHHAIPVLKLAFDGQEQASDKTKLQAFVHQARQHMLSSEAARVHA